MAIERGLKINGMIKRFDIVIYNALGKPHLAIECKAPSVKLTQSTLQQLATYNKLKLEKSLLIDQKIRIPLTDTNFIQEGNTGVPLYYKTDDKQRSAS